MERAARFSPKRPAAAPGRRAAADLLPALYADLKSLARSLTARFPPGDALPPTALVHEAYLRLVGHADPGWDDHAHFFGAAARAMRQVLVDRARHNASRKAGVGLMRVDVDGLDLAIHPPTDDMLALGECLRSLQRAHEPAAKVTTLRYLAGLSVKETAWILGLSLRATEREWAFARGYLATMMCVTPDDELSPQPRGG